MISLIITSTSAFQCGIINSSPTSTAKWYNPSGLCENCYCQWSGYTYCYGGCNSQKLWYNVQLTSADPFSRPNLDNLHYCHSVAEDIVSVTASCYHTDTKQIISNLAGIALLVRKPTACACGQIGGSGSTDLPALETGDIDDAKESIKNQFDDKTEVVTTINH